MIVLSCDDRRTPNLFHYLSTTPSRIMHMIIDTHWYHLNATFDVRTSITTVLKWCNLQLSPSQQHVNYLRCSIFSVALETTLEFIFVAKNISSRVQQFLFCRWRTSRMFFHSLCQWGIERWIVSHWSTQRNEDEFNSIAFPELLEHTHIISRHI